ncbi:MAG TPA: hypothetical protein VM688_02360 [Nocardioidaceae bacterium]|jgi:hypothetical protein|nr:hypothetical protein [Nocardioidaceae bacterium]
MKSSLVGRLIAIALGGTFAVIFGVSPASAASGVTYIYSGDGDTLRAVFYEHADFTGAQLKYYGGSACTSTTADADYSRGVVPNGWNDVISAVRDYNGCDVKLYMDGPFAGRSTGYVNYGSVGRYVGYDFNDKTSSFRIS